MYSEVPTHQRKKHFFLIGCCLFCSSSFDNTFHSANSDLHPLGFHKPLYSTIRVISKLRIITLIFLRCIVLTNSTLSAFSFFALILGTITAVVFGLVFGILEAINMYILRPVTVMILLSYGELLLSFSTQLFSYPCEAFEFCRSHVVIFSNFAVQRE